MMKKLLIIISLNLLLIGCATTAHMQAPCDAYGTGCGPKIKINQWS